MTEGETVYLSVWVEIETETFEKWTVMSLMRGMFFRCAQQAITASPFSMQAADLEI